MWKHIFFSSDIKTPGSHTQNPPSDQYLDVGLTLKKMTTKFVKLCDCNFVLFLHMAAEYSSFSAGGGVAHENVIAPSS